MPAANVTRLLAAFVLENRFDSLPGPVVHEARRALLHWIGCAVGGSRSPSVDSAIAAVAPFTGAPHASVLGRGERLDALHAAFINGVSTDVLSFSDTHPETLIHPTGVLGPALVALAEIRKTTGKELLHALITGFEVASRVSLAIYPWHYDRGWHITGTAGTFGAAAAAGKILGLNIEQMTWALGIAATEAAGLRGMFGSMCKNFHSGRAAENGMLAARLAGAGFTSAPDGIGGARCFAEVFCDAPQLERISLGLGTTYEITRNTYKAYPCGVVIHPVIDACLRIARGSNLRAGDIDLVEVRANPYVLELTGRREPLDTLEAKLSVYHSAAAALIAGRISEREYSAQTVNRPDVLALRRKVSVATEPAIREDEAHVVVRLADGTALREHVEHALGSAGNPLSDSDIESKVKALCEPYIAEPKIHDLVNACWNVTELADAAALPKLARVD